MKAKKSSPCLKVLPKRVRSVFPSDMEGFDDTLGFQDDEDLLDVNMGFRARAMRGSFSDDEVKELDFS